ncbi:response regulator transcription factor [Hydrogenophaga sp. 5NK40-0174]|uniref:response regulator transcription factor n=1 Tax=Hydrogenophaga sp. 5NK40-0174 TaxID=3127649 RepID=UPI00333FCC73
MDALSPDRHLAGSDHPPIILVVEDHSMLRESLADHLAQRFPHASLLEARSLSEACRVVENHLPTVVVLDLHLDDAKGVTALAEIRRRCPASRIVVLSGSVDPATTPHLLATGANGFVSKSGRREELVTAIQEQLMHLASARPPHRSMAPLSDRLTPQQTVMLEHLLNGLSNKDIARQTGLSHGTVRNYVSVLLAQFQVTSRAQLQALFKR